MEGLIHGLRRYHKMLFAHAPAVPRPGAAAASGAAVIADPLSGPRFGASDADTSSVPRPAAARLRRLVLLSSLVTLLLFWAFAASMIVVQRDLAIDQARDNAINLAAAFKNDVKRVMDSIASAAGLVSERFRHEGISALDLASWTQGVLLATIQISVIGPDGKLVATTLDPHPVPLDLSDREHFRVHVGGPTKGFFIGKPVVGRVSHQVTIQVSKRLERPDGSFGGVVVFSVGPRQLTALSGQVDLGRSGVVTIVGLDGIIRARFSGNAEKDASAIGMSLAGAPDVEGARVGAGGDYERTSSLDGITRYVAWHLVDGYPLIVAVGLVKAEALASVDRLTTWLLGVGGIVTLVVGLLTLLLNRLSVRQIDAEKRLRGSEERFRTLTLATTQIVWLTNSAGESVEDSPSWREFTGQDYGEMLGHGWAGAIHPDDTARVLKEWDRAVAAKTMLRTEYRVRGRDGNYREFLCNGVPVIDADRTVREWIGTCTDVTERKRAEDQIQRLARYDKLTGLANRHVFVEALERAIGRARRGAKGFAILYLDLDHFKDVNDTLGHPAGDILLELAAERLRANVRAVDTVARFGGDEFAIILTDIEEPTDAAVASDRIRLVIDEAIAAQEVADTASGVAEKILDVVHEPFLIEGNEVHSGASIGIAVYGHDSPDAETMLSRADVALYRAKSDARGTYRFFDDAMDREVRARVAMSTELRAAIASEQLFLMYQPQVEIDTGRIVGLEALVRWRHPTRGIVWPGHFIPDAERNGLIVPLGRWVLREAARQTRQWLDAGIEPLPVAVNLSGVQFKRPLELENDIGATLPEFDVPARLLELELTESVLMGASRDNNDVLLRLREKGHRIAIDDFGSGYSSLDYLCRYPVDRIKIAQSFIMNIGIVAGNDAIVRAALGLARELGIEVVVEGVETIAQLDLLKIWGGRIVQGYYFARPLPVPEITALLRAGTITPATAEPAEIAVS